MHRGYYPHRVYQWRTGDLPTWSIQSDASYADDLYDRYSQGGYAGGWDHHPVTTATSCKSHRVATSTYQAESAHCSNACKEVEYKRNVFTFLRVLRPGPTALAVDNYATYLAAGAPIRKWSPRSKQHDIEERYIVECVERGTITIIHKPGSLPLDAMPGDGFRVDAMTKPLSSKVLNHYYRELHGPITGGDTTSPSITNDQHRG